MLRYGRAATSIQEEVRVFLGRQAPSPTKRASAVQVEHGPRVVGATRRIVSGRRAGATEAVVTRFRSRRERLPGCSFPEGL